MGADVRCLPFADNQFDIILSNSILDHFQSSGEIVTSLRELHRVLRPGGQLILTLDNLANPIIALRSLLPFRLLNRLELVPYFIGVTCSPRTLQHALTEIGFKVLEVSTVIHCPRILAVRVAGILQRFANSRTQRRLLRILMMVEYLSRLPTRFFTGHLTAAQAIKLPSCNASPFG